MLCSYQFDRLLYPQARRSFYIEMCAQPQGFCTTENVGRGAAYENDVLGAGLLHRLAFKLENCQHSHLGFKVKLSECRGGPGKAQKAQNAITNCLLVLAP